MSAKEPWPLSLCGVGSCAEKCPRCLQHTMSCTSITHDSHCGGGDDCPWQLHTRQPWVIWQPQLRQRRRFLTSAAANETAVAGRAASCSRCANMLILRVLASAKIQTGFAGVTLQNRLRGQQEQRRRADKIEQQGRHVTISRSGRLLGRLPWPPGLAKTSTRTYKKVYIALKTQTKRVL